MTNPTMALMGQEAGQETGGERERQREREKEREMRLERERERECDIRPEREREESVSVHTCRHSRCHSHWGAHWSVWLSLDDRETPLRLSSCFSQPRSLREVEITIDVIPEGGDRIWGKTLKSGIL